MKSIVRITGLCLVAMFTVSMVAAGTAQAKWEQCAKGGSGTKYTEHQCLTASSGGEWSWQEVTNSEEVRIRGSLKLTTIKVPIVGKVVVECSGEAIGHVGPGQLGRIDEVKTSAPQCRNVENCEAVEEAEARNTPWQTETYDTEGKVLAKLEEAGKGAPGWKVKCKVLGTPQTNECTQKAGEPESILLENRKTLNEHGEVELLVLATFQHLRKAKCTVSGTEGEVSGSLAILKANGWGLRVS